MTARKRTRRSTGGAEGAGRAEGPTRRGGFQVIADGLYELRLGRRVSIDVLVTTDGELLTFLRVDGALVAELPVKGKA